jgi:O-antigen ligase
MTTLSIDRPRANYLTKRSHAVLILQVFALAVTVIPSTTTIKVIGAGGYLAALVSDVIFLAWVASTLLGLHRPQDYHYPIRFSLCAVWLVSLASYALMNRGLLTAAQGASADRWLIQLSGASGVVLVGAECLHSIEEIKKVLRPLVWGGAFCGVMAGLQFKLRLDMTPYLKSIPGFSQSSAGYLDIVARGQLNRVVGTAIQPIELGVVSGMLLPLAVYLAIYDIGRSKESRWLPVLCIAIGIPTSVSRSAIIATGISLGVFIVSMQPVRRLKALGVLALAVVAVFVTVGGVISTLAGYFLAGTSDSSVAHRINNYPFVEHLVEQSPWLGHGGGTYIGGTYLAHNTVHVLDNQYLTTAIELGLLGVAVLVYFFLCPVLAAFRARSLTDDIELKDLSTALAGSTLAAVICSGTFDSLSFPMFANIQILLFGLIGAVWLIVNRNRESDFGMRSTQSRINGAASICPPLTQETRKPDREI